MKKCIKVLRLFLLMILIMVSTVTFASDISVTLNGIPVRFDVAPQMINDRTMVPLRAIFEALGATVKWDNNTQTVSAFKDDTIVVATIGNNKMYINDEETVMDVAPVIVNDRTLVPVRFVAEAFNCNVDWNGSTQTVIITHDDNDELYKDLGEQGED